MEQKEIIGTIKGVELSNGEKNDGTPWTRASIKLDVGNDKVLTLSTFDTNDIDTANQLNGKTAKLIFTETQKPGSTGNTITYRNLIKGGVVASAQEVIHSQNVLTTQTPTTNHVNSQSVSTTSNDYWQMKFDWEKQTNAERQTKIIRQNSWTQANEFVKNLLKSVELGIVSKEGVISKIITIVGITEFAHKIEQDINRMDVGFSSTKAKESKPEPMPVQDIPNIVEEQVN